MDSAGCIRQHGYVDLRRNELMDTRFIIYFVFICLKNFELSWVVCRINKVIRMNFVELGTITAFSEIAGFCFIVSRSQSADFLLWWKETVFLDRFACIGGFVILSALRLDRRIQTADIGIGFFHIFIADFPVNGLAKTERLDLPIHANRSAP